MEPQILWTEVPVSKSDQVVVTENIYLFMPTFGSSVGKQSLRVS